MVESIEPNKGITPSSGSKQSKDVRELGGLKDTFRAMAQSMPKDVVAPTVIAPVAARVVSMNRMDVMGWERAIAVGAEAFDADLPAAVMNQRIDAIAADIDSVRNGRHQPSGPGFSN